MEYVVQPEFTDITLSKYMLLHLGFTMEMWGDHLSISRPSA